VPGSELHEKYAPIMRFSGEERFFPMSVNDFLKYSALYVKGQETPLVPTGKVRPDDLVVQRNSPETFLRSVATGPFHGVEVASKWGMGAMRLIYQWSQNPVVTWTEEWARSAYDWFSQKTKAATCLFWWNRLLLPKTYADKRRGVREELPRFDLPPEARESAIEAYQASQGRERNYTYYYRRMHQSGYEVLQYWFFYAYNDWASGYAGFNDHEGDWEGFQVFFKLDSGNHPMEPPAYVCYLDHNSRLSKPWDHSEVEKVGTHPVIYVAAGSHASYPEAKQYPLMALYDLIDYASGDGLTLDHSEWRNRVNLETVPWLSSYRGSWGTRYWLPLAWVQKALRTVRSSIPGEVYLPGVSAPRGPRFSDEGSERLAWRDPAAFAGIA
jgi:hypothetical protein